MEENSDDTVVFDSTADTGKMSTALYIALLAIFCALTTVATIMFIIPIPSTFGYFNLGDALVMLSGILLGPVGGFIAGGIGSAMGDVALGYFAFAPFTFLIKGGEGLIVGMIGRYSNGSQIPRPWDLLAVILGAIVMLSGYYIAEVVFLGISPMAALLELVAFNSIQVIAGGIISITIGPMLRGFLQSYTKGIM
ncbi:MAG: ECF transporter S component [Candidatus Thorarchaeota archaeon]